MRIEKKVTRAFFLILVLIVFCLGLTHTTKANEYDLENNSSEELTAKAWAALKERDVEAVLVYTNECINLYAGRAKRMQAELESYPTGSNDDVHQYWAINDVATSLYIQAEAFREVNMMEEATEVYIKIINDYSFGQTWDPRGWFWKPAEAAQDRLDVIESGKNIDFGNYSSEFLTTQAWNALNTGDLDSVDDYADKVISLYAEKAKEMQNFLEDYPLGSNEDIHLFSALNDVGTVYFIKAQAQEKKDDKDGAIYYYKKIINSYSYSQCWNPEGWFWKPAEGAKDRIHIIRSGKNIDFGNYSSEFLTTQAWKALNAGDFESVNDYADKVISLYADKAKEMQDALSGYPWESNAIIHSHWALNDVGTVYFIKGEAERKAGNNKRAINYYEKVVSNFYFSQCWDPEDWFWKPADAAQQALDELEDEAQKAKKYAHMKSSKRIGADTKNITDNKLGVEGGLVVSNMTYGSKSPMIGSIENSEVIFNNQSESEDENKDSVWGKLWWKVIIPISISVIAAALILKFVKK